MLQAGRPLVSSGLTNVSPSAPEIGQRSHTRPQPATGCSPEYLEAVTGKGVTLLSRPSASTVTVPTSPPSSASSRSTGSRPPAAGRPSGLRANGEGVADDSGTRYGRQPSGKDRSPVCTS
ncbi:hypothetical protein GCM10023238_15150 [Streptomyces heliomycini]